MKSVVVLLSPRPKRVYMCYIMKKNPEMSGSNYEWLLVFLTAMDSYILIQLVKNSNLVTRTFIFFMVRAARDQDIDKLLTSGLVSSPYICISLLLILTIL